MDISEFTNSISPVQLQDTSLGSASHLSLATALNSIPQAVSLHQHHNPEVHLLHHANHNITSDKDIDHQLQQFQAHQHSSQQLESGSLSDQDELLLAPDTPLNISQNFPSKDALLNHLNRYAALSGFRLSRTSSRPEHIRIQCWKRAKTSKYTRTSDPDKRRASYGSTRSTSCPFFLNCWHNKKSGCWYIKSSNIFHNHDFSQDQIKKKSLTAEEQALLRDLSYVGSEVTRSIPVKIINAKRREIGIPDVDPKLVTNTLTRYRMERSEETQSQQEQS
ncbi:hypothetical protein V1514DRAFT_335055 [Lipomyces japonicus]|uniref:uncharacterized protein n=1 Tax=Lipomyces japonicus TaxID=56871 RepID=UPI0034CE0C57